MSRLHQMSRSLSGGRPRRRVLQAGPVCDDVASTLRLRRIAVVRARLHKLARLTFTRSGIGDVVIIALFFVIVLRGICQRDV